MKTKILLLPLLALVPAFSLGALPEFTLSAGGGLTMGGLFTNYIINANETSSGGLPTYIKLTQEMQQFNFGGYVFFDAAYGELSVDIQQGFNKYSEKATIVQSGKGAKPDREGTGSETVLGFTLLAKYPIELKKNLLFYPLAGIQYQIALAEKRRPSGDREYNRTEGKTEFDENKDYKLSMWNAFFVKIGAGLDFYFYGPFYLRTEFLYSFRLLTNYENAAVDWLVDEYRIKRPKLFTDPGMRGLTHGPELRLAVGYRFR